jgi:hypothetical protein
MSIRNAICIFNHEMNGMSSDYVEFKGERGMQLSFDSAACVEVNWNQ